MKPVVVVWEDHVGLGAEWMPVAEAVVAPTELCRSVGFLLSIRKDALVLGGTLDQDGTGTGDVFVIMRSGVHDVKCLIS